MTQAPETSSGRGRTITWRRTWRVLRYVVGLVLAAVALEAVFGKRDELSGASTYLNHVNWIWIGVLVLIAGTLVALVPSKVSRSYARTEVVGTAKKNAPVEV